MPNTTNRGYFYPGVNDAPDGPYAYQQLAEGMDADVEDIDTRLTAHTEAMPAAIQAGKGTISIGAGAASTTLAITFPAAFAAPPVVVVTSTANVAGRGSLLRLYANNITATGFTVKMQTSDNQDIGTGYAHGFNWVAVAS